MEATVDTATQVCDICADEDFVVFRTSGRHGQPLQTVICNCCGLVYTNPRPSDADDPEFYKSRYWGDYRSKTTPDERFFRRRIPKVRDISVRCLQLLDDVESPRVLEIGCGVGALSLLLHEGLDDGAEITAIEPSKGHSAFAKQRTGLDVRHGLLDEIASKLAAETFDLVVMNHVLEHVPSAREVCTCVLGLLCPGGRFVIEVPNVEQPGSRLSHFFHVAHNFNFSPATLRRLALSTGFEVESIEALDGDLPGTRLFAVLTKGRTPETSSLPSDGAAERAASLKRYGRWYTLTLASLRKKVTHAMRQRH
jgi:2-polyprenyl-3-methyl-5-hydroxy-6-metoxy-1,4-benzoquinol methylase